MPEMYGNTIFIIFFPPGFLFLEILCIFGYHHIYYLSYSRIIIFIIQHKSTRRASTKTESFISILVLLALALIIFTLFIKQAHFDEEIFTITLGQHGVQVVSTEPADKELSIFSSLIPDGFNSMSAPEEFDESTLSDKINGKAELYFEADFIKLQCQRFVDAETPRLWYEFFLYDMGEPVNSFSVFSNQRRADSISRDITRFSYSTTNAVFFSHGKYYIEIVAAEPSETLMQGMLTMGQRFIDSHPQDDFVPQELALLPEENLQKETIKYYLRNAFSFDKFNNVLAGMYSIDGNNIMGFVSLRETPEAATTLVAEYTKFLTAIGGEELSGDSDIPGLRIVDLIGTHEIVFSHKRVVAGVHSAMDKEQGLKLAQMLFNSIAQKQP